MSGTLTHERSDVPAALARMRCEMASAPSAAERSLHDGLTSLPNRSSFYEWLRRALVQFQPPYQAVTVLFLDIDDFKSLNETFGDKIGDEVLKRTAARLSGAVRSEDMVSRLGNDEFGCVIVGMAVSDQFRAIASTLLAAVSAPMSIGALEFTLRASIGIATSPADGMDANTLMENAARAMYRSKKNQSGFAFFESRVVLRDDRVGAGAIQPIQLR